MKAFTTKRYVVKQKVQTCNRAWLEEVFSSPCKRTAVQSYHQLCYEWPDSYFELTETIDTETCLAFTPHKG